MTPEILDPPAGGCGDVAAWVADNHGWLRQEVVRHGAVRLRGFGVDTAAAFESLAEAWAPALQAEYLGTSPRIRLRPRIHTSTELPGWYLIPQHPELSFLPDPPRWLLFCCLIPPARGGETPLVDLRAVWNQLEPDVRQRFLDRGLRVVRCYDGPGSRGLDPWKTKRWDEMFGTTDRAAIEATAADNGMQAEWRPGDRLRLTTVQDAVRVHPETGETAWHNHLVVFHPTVAASEYRRLFRRRRDWRDAALAVLGGLAMAVRRRVTDPDDLATNVTYRDGSPIPNADVEQVRDAVWRNLVALPWRRGDVAILDNLTVAHGRFPYRGSRRVAVCWAAGVKEARAAR